MGAVLYLLAYLSYALFFVICVLCLAAGLYYLAEFVEEYVFFTKKVLTRLLQFVIFLHVTLLFFDRLPLSFVLLGLASHLLYYQLLNRYPFLEFSDPLFIASCVLAVVDHCTWFVYFSGHYYPFGEILAFFTICVWSVPFGFFISLSANENALPGSVGATIDLNEIGKERKKKSSNVLLSWFGSAVKSSSSVLPGSLGPSNYEKMT